MGRNRWLRLLLLVLFVWLAALAVSHFVLRILPDSWQMRVVWAVSILAGVVAVLGNLAQALGLFRSARQEPRPSKSHLLQLQDDVEESEQSAPHEAQAQQIQRGAKKSKQRIS